jgi:GTP cyclohydrolase I
MQEQMTHQIAQSIYTSKLGPIGVGVVVSGHHTCMSMRGVKSGGSMVTSAMLGILRTSARDEFLRLAGY